MEVNFSVLGEPKGKARPKTVKLKNGASHTYTPDGTVLYENLIATEYRRQIGDVSFPDKEMLEMRVIAYFTIPGSASKKTKMLMEDREIRPTKKPDMDNIVKVVADALNKVAFRDDSQIVECRISKYYSTQPRIEVTILSAKTERSIKLLWD